MSWVITPSFYGYIADADAKDYLSRVHAAEGQTLEPAVALAVEAFVVGCKADGIWTAIKASCILAGACTLTGALVPLVGTAPTNVGPFVSGDYNRKTGLVGNGSTKYLNSNRFNTDSSQDSLHAAVYTTTIGTGAGRTYIGTSFNSVSDISIATSSTAGRLSTKCNTASDTSTESVNAQGLIGVSRSVSASYVLRANATNATINVASATPTSRTIAVYARGSTNLTTARLAFYSIGESLDLALLDARVTTLVNAFAAAIP
jgi:hypothetical protein